MNVRVAVAPFALALVVITPAIVDTATEPDTPKPPESTLTISVSDSTEAIRLVNAGEPTTEVSTPLVDASGETVSEIRVVEPTEAEYDATCSSAPVHDTGRRAADGTSVTTCLQLSGLEPATSVSGTITGTGVTLTTNYPKGWGWFALLVLAGLIVAGLLLLLAGIVKKLAGSVVLDDLLDRNERAGQRQIEGLRRWAAGLRDIGNDDGTIRTKVDDARRTVPGHARNVRRKLDKAAADVEAGFALRTALIRASRKPVTVTDYYGDDGEALARAQLLDLVDLVAPLEQEIQRLDAMTAAIGALDPSSAKSTAETAIADARGSAQALESADELTSLKAQVEAAGSAVQNAISTSPGGSRAARFATGPSVAVTETPEPPFSVNTPNRVLAWVLFLIYGLAILALAVVALYLANYANKPAFGTVDDQLALFIAATGSTAAGSIAAAVGWWRVEETKA